MEALDEIIKDDAAKIATIVILFAILVAGALFYSGYAYFEINELENKLVTIGDDLVESERMNAVRGTYNDRMEIILSDVFNREFTHDLPVFAKLVTVTAYTARIEECDETPEVTSSGRPSRVGAIAVSRDLEARGISLGDMVVIKGMGLFRVEDRTGEFKRKNTDNPIPVTNTVDILHANIKAAKKFGTGQEILIWLGKGSK
jgi:3D (Asp-Asp-Asp) domain-containing protein